MSRWHIEKNGTGIEKSGTGIEKSGTGIEKSGTGIEKSGTGIEKSGTGIQRVLLACAIVATTFASQVNASEIRPEGLMSVTADQGQVSVMWNIDGNTFVGKGSQVGTFTQISLFELSVSNDSNMIDIAGGGTGTEIAGGGTGTEIAGGGTGKEIAGGGTGVEIAGGGTGVEIAGGGTGIEIAGGGTGVEIAGGGTGTEIAGGGTGVEIAGGGTGTTIQIAGGGTGTESVFLTLPAGTGLEMEIILGCKTASVTVLDSSYAEVVSFTNIPVMGDTGMCVDGGNGFNPIFGAKDYR
jgi:hypothetical protein